MANVYASGKVEITLPTSNAFAQNMAKAKAKVSAMKIQKEKFSGVKVEKKLPIIFNRKVEFTN